jgi:hypothetical protein
MDTTGSVEGPAVGFREHANEPSGSIIADNFGWLFVKQGDFVEK